MTCLRRTFRLAPLIHPRRQSHEASFESRLLRCSSLLSEHSFEQRTGSRLTFMPFFCCATPRAPQNRAGMRACATNGSVQWPNWPIRRLPNSLTRPPRQCISPVTPPRLADSVCPRDPFAFSKGVSVPTPVSRLRDPFPPRAVQSPFGRLTSPRRWRHDAGGNFGAPYRFTGGCG